MSVRAPLLISLLVALAMAAAGAWVWQVLLPHAVVTTHWSLGGQPNGYSGKALGLFIMPALAAILSLAFAAITRIEPRRFNLASSVKFFHAAWFGLLAVMAVGQAMIVATALGYAPNVRSCLLIAVSLLFIVVGNYLGKTRSNFFVGIRTPWTLSSEFSWKKTHRLGGRLFIATAILTLVALLAAGAKSGMLAFIVLLVATLLVCIVMSYIYWSRDPERNEATSRAT